MSLAAELAGRHGGTVAEWTARLVDIGVPPGPPRAALSSEARRKVDRLVRGHRRPRRGRKGPAATPEEAPTLGHREWARRALARYVDRVEPWRVEGASAALLDRARDMAAVRSPGTRDDPTDALDISALSEALGAEAVGEAPEAIALVAAMAHDYAVRRVVWTLAPYSLGIGFPRRLLAAVLASSGRDPASAHVHCPLLEGYRHRGVDYVRLSTGEGERSETPDDWSPSAEALGGLLEVLSTRPPDSPPLVLSEVATEGLEHLADRWRYRDTVHRSAATASPGVIACLSGPEGHGKRTAVRDLAGELGLPLYRIAPGRLASRYIGETERRISALFERVPAESILMIDGAQDLLTARVDVRRSNDRYSNMSVNHLLTCLDDWPGLTVLVVDRTSNLDAAMQRRIAVTVHFEAPDEAHWEAIAGAQWGWLRARLAADPGPGVDDVASWCAMGQRLSPARLLWVLMDLALDSEARRRPMTVDQISTKLHQELATMGYAVRSAAG
ncbi:MAG: ATP-binding protein [Myxococcota bacterium]|nr:ATP-binding protein [Myxococcota bacterium]